MNITLKRIISMILVFTLMLSLPGCASIDGRPVSMGEAILWIVDGVLQISILLLGELVLLVVFLLINLLLSAIESATGGEWWDVEEVGGPIMRGYGRLVDPKCRFIDWREDEEYSESATEPATEPVTEPAEETTEETFEKLYADPELPTEVFHAESSGTVGDYEEKWGRYTIHYETNGGTVQTEDGGVLQDQYVWKWTVKSWWPNPPKVLDQRPYRPQYRFLGWGLTPDAQTIDYAPNMSLKGITDSMTLYAIWGECANHVYAVNEVKDNKLLCKYCHSPIPMSELKFSVFLEHYYSGETPEKMKPERKEEALNRYIMIKTLMTEDELSDVLDFVTWGQAKEMGVFEKVALANDIFAKALDFVTAKDTSHVFYMNFVAMCVAVDDIKSEHISAKVMSFLNDAGTVSAAVTFMTSTMDASKKADTYKVAKEAGVEYTYYQEEAYLELVAANAKSVAELMKFTGLFCNMSLDAPTPDVDGLLEKLKKQSREMRLMDIYRDLYLPFGNKTHNAAELNVNDILANQGIKGQFEDPKNFESNGTDERILAAMKRGPTAKDIQKVIPYIVDRTNEGDKAKMAAALWYYYGWRLQYDYECFIQDILNDRI